MVAQHLIQKYHLTDLDPGSRAEMFPFQKGLWSSDIPSERYQRLARSWNDGRMQSVAAGMAMCDDIYRDGLNQRGLSVKEQTDLTVDHGSCQNAAALPGMLILPTTYGGAATTAAVVASSGVGGVVRGAATASVRNTTKAVSITLRTEARAIIRAEQAAAKSAAWDRAVQSMSGKTPPAKKPLTPTPKKPDGGVSGSISSRSSSSSSSAWTVRPGQEWKEKIVGTAQKTGTPGHDVRSYRVAVKAAKESDTEKVFLNRGYNLASGQKIKSNRRPDVIIKKTDGTLHPREVPSRTDKARDLKIRNEEALEKLPKEIRGEYEKIDITKMGGD